jgi:hypothetical protein
MYILKFASGFVNLYRPVGTYHFLVDIYWRGIRKVSAFRYIKLIIYTLPQIPYIVPFYLYLLAPIGISINCDIGKKFYRVGRFGFGAYVSTAAIRKCIVRPGMGIINCA